MLPVDNPMFADWGVRKVMQKQPWQPIAVPTARRYCIFLEFWNIILKKRYVSLFTYG